MNLIDSRKIVLCLETTNIENVLFNLFLNDFKFFTYQDNITNTLKFVSKTLVIQDKFNIDVIILDNPDHILAIRQLTQKIPIIILSNNEISYGNLKCGNIFCFKYTTDKEDWKNIFTYLWDTGKRREVIPSLQLLQILNYH